MANDAKFNFYLNRQGPRGQKGEKGDAGFSPSITVNTDTADEYTLLIQNEYDSFVTDNIRPTYDDRGGTYVRVDRDNNVQYFGSADIATTANYGEVKLAQASDLASTVDVGNSNVITVELLKTWFDGQLADNLVTTTNNVTIQGQKVFATPTRFMDTVRVGNRLMVTQDDTGTITFDSSETGTVVGTDATFNKDVRVNGGTLIGGNLNVNGATSLFGNANILGTLDVKNGLTVQAGGIKVQGGELDANGRNTITQNLILSPGPLKTVKGFSGFLYADTSAILPEEYITVGDERLPLRLVGTKVLANGKDVATADTVDAIQSDLNIAKQDIIEAQGDIDNLQMNKQNKLTAGTGITIDADNVISATGGATIDDSTTATTSVWSSSKTNTEITTAVDTINSTKNDNIFDIGKFTVVGNPTITDDGVASGFTTSNYLTTKDFIIGQLSGKSWTIRNKFYADLNEVPSFSYGINDIINLSESYHSYGYMGMTDTKSRIMITTGITGSNQNFYNECAISQSGWVEQELSFDVNTGTYTFKHLVPGDSNWHTSTWVATTENKELLRINVAPTDKIKIGRGLESIIGYGSIDLKQFSITVDGKEVFNGLMESTKPIYDKISTTSTALSTFQTDTDNNFSAVNSALNEKANLSDLALKQNILVSGTNIKTINGETILGEGNINVVGSTPINMVTTDTAQDITANKTFQGEINAVSIKTTGLRSDDIQTTTNKKYLTEVDVDNQTIQVVDGKLHANLDESALANKQDKLTAGKGLNIADVYTSSANNLNTVNYPDSVYAKTQFNVSSTNPNLGFAYDMGYVRPDTSITAMENIVKYGSVLIPFEKNFVYVIPQMASAIGYMDGDIFVPVFSPANFDKYYTSYDNTTGSVTIKDGFSPTDGHVSVNRKHSTIVQLLDNAFIRTTSGSSNKVYYKYDISGIDFIQGKDLFICVAQWGEYNRYGNNRYLLHSDSPLKILKYDQCNIGKFATTADLTTDAGTPDDNAPNLLDLSPKKQTVISSTTPISYLTRAQYDALETKDANTMYVITDEEGGGGGTGDIPIATTTTAGKVKPDGTTITITDDGTISAVGGGGGGGNNDGSASMPSNKYIDLTLGTSGTTYTAPANGWFSIYTLNIFNFQLFNTSKNYGITSYGKNGLAGSCTLPANKGDVVKVTYDSSGKINFKFIYAEGNK